MDEKLDIVTAYGVGTMYVVATDHDRKHTVRRENQLGFANPRVLLKNATLKDAMAFVADVIDGELDEQEV